MKTGFNQKWTKADCAQEWKTFDENLLNLF